MDIKGSDKAVKTNSGRQRVNINGAICFHTKEVVYREDETINRDSTVFLLAKIRSKHDADKDITVVLDNAKYNRAKDVTEYASRHKIKLLYLPSYSTNLNLIERFWKYLKEKICTTYYEHFGEFIKAITDFLDNIFISWIPESSRNLGIDSCSILLILAGKQMSAKCR